MYLTGPNVMQNNIYNDSFDINRLHNSGRLPISFRYCQKLLRF